MLKFLVRLKILLIRMFLGELAYSRVLGVIHGVGCKFEGKNDFGTEPYLINIGNYVSLTNVKFFTHDGCVRVFRNLKEEDSDIDLIKPIKIGNNVFIGSNALLLPGVKICDNVIIGAGSIVVKDIYEEGVYAGVPAKYIRSLEDMRSKISDDLIHTKHYSKIEKKKYLINKFM